MGISGDIHIYIYIHTCIHGYIYIYTHIDLAQVVLQEVVPQSPTANTTPHSPQSLRQHFNLFSHQHLRAVSPQVPCHAQGRHVRTLGHMPTDNDVLSESTCAQQAKNVRCKPYIDNVPTTPGIKMKHDTFLPAVSASAQRLMGDPSLRCLTCGGKFGAPVSDLRCELCSLVFRFQDVVSSDRFPATGGQFVVPDLRSLYLKSLEVCDSYLRFQQGDKESPRTQEGEAKKEEPDKQLLTTPKVKPPVKKELADEKEEKKVFKEEDVKRAKSPEQRIEAEVRKENKERKTTSRDREGDVRARSSGIHRRREKDAECIKEAERRQREEAKEGRLPG